MSEAISAESLRDDFMAHVRGLTRHWTTVEGLSVEERLEGLAHSILVTIDGCSGGFPVALDLVCRPHPDDKAFNISEGDDWIEDGTVLNADDMLHELLYQRPA